MKHDFCTLFTVLFLGSGACGPKDVIPRGPSHPASAEAATRQSHQESPEVNAATESAPAHENHEGREKHDGGEDHGSHGSPAQAAPKQDETQAIAAAEESAYERARPVFETYCTMCHSTAGKKATKSKLGHFNMDTYPFGGHHAKAIGAAIRKVLGAAGEEATMPMNAPGSVKGEALEAIIEWSEAFDRSHAAGLHGHGEHGEHH